MLSKCLLCFSVLAFVMCFLSFQQLSTDVLPFLLPVTARETAGHLFRLEAVPVLIDPPSENERRLVRALEFDLQGDDALPIGRRRFEDLEREVLLLCTRKYPCLAQGYRRVSTPMSRNPGRRIGLDPGASEGPTRGENIKVLSIGTYNHYYLISGSVWLYWNSKEFPPL